MRSGKQTPTLARRGEKGDRMIKEKRGGDRKTKN